MKNKIICFFKGHKRGKTIYKYKKTIGHTWNIVCKRCGYKIGYVSPNARLVSTEISSGFDGK